MDGRQRKRLGERLVQSGTITPEQLETALEHHQRWGVRLGASLVALGMISEDQLVSLLSRELGLPIVDLDRLEFDSDATHLLPASLAVRFHMVPVRTEEDQGRVVLVLAMADPQNAEAVEQVWAASSCGVRRLLAKPSSICRALHTLYAESGVAGLQVPVSEQQQVCEREPVVDGAVIETEPVVQATLAVSPMAEQLKALARVLLKKGLITTAELEEELMIVPYPSSWSTSNAA